MTEWDWKTRELKRKKMLWKQQAWERGDETGSDDDDDEEFDEVVADMDWDVMEMAILIFHQVMVTIVVAENDTSIWLQIEDRTLQS